MKKISFRSVAIRTMALVAGFTMLFVSSCEKDDPALVTPSFKKPKQNSSLSYEVNASTAGTLHNECLTAIGDNIQDPSHLGSMDHFNEQRDIVADFYSDNNLTFPSFVDQSMVQQTIAQIQNNTLLTNLENTGAISPAVKGELETIISILQNASTHSGATNELNSFINNIEASSYNDDEKTLLIGTANVAISTGEFWEAAYDNASNPWHERSVPAAGEPVYAGKVKWWKMLGDVLGFTAGALAGGTPLTPTGVAAGAALGGMISACIDA